MARASVQLLTRFSITQTVVAKKEEVEEERGVVSLFFPLGLVW